ncbi:glycoside hydrolase family 16 protein [Alteromonas sp. RKMC-009]|uniref:glycoside hydrolase family 16 protein n=1 Tax=Alteromonas sp. RKMC-009 TaxID=2267264 RepID=UPI000E6A9416|nr:glycoside hydrolase family 16 protein [Alteromonas sp. RKMC-009]AYA63440.1 glycoside hydrolase family 16 protein [Alteromonas sp. RKMC-009]
MTKTFLQLSRLAAAISVTTLVGCGGGATTNTDVNIVEPTVPVTDWELVWSDDFDGSSIDGNNWTHEVNCAGGGNNESQCYTDSPENAFVSDGTLKIVALPAAEGAEKPYTSARLVTQYKADFKYGRFEMRAKLPSGQGSWPAFWMMPTDSVYGGWPRSGEIDIMEAVNLKAMDADGNPEANIHGTLHYGSEWPNNKYSGKAYKLPDGANPADDFHTYAVEWQEGEIRWYMDDYLYATQRKSTVRYNSKGEATGLAHRGWYTEYFDQTSGELQNYYTNAPFDQEFFMILNLAVGGDWPSNVNELGIDPEAFTEGQTYEIDYVHVYQCSTNPDTGKGCETVRPGYDSTDDALVEGEAPIPSPPSSGVAQNLTIFGGTDNPNWPAWDCCGGSTPAIVDDAEKGDVYEFSIGATPTVMGFVSRSTFITDPNGQATPFDGAPMVETGSVKFDLKVTSLPSEASAAWLFKIESSEGSTAVEFPLATGYTGPNESAGDMPEEGVWETYEFPLSMLDEAGLDVSAIDVIMVFPAWGAGDGATYRLTNVEISAESSYPELVIFEDATNPNWPMWDCCGGSTPTEEMDDDAHGLTAEFRIGAEPTVMGFITRPADGGGDTPFDATALADGGLLQFDMRVVSLPNDASAAWLFKVESNGASTAIELPITESVEGEAPVEGEWQTYTFPIADLQAGGLDISAIDVIMVFPAWGAGEGAAYRIDNMKLYHPGAGAAAGLTLFADTAADMWSVWDCCGGSTPTIEADDDAHGDVAEFRIGGTPTVMGFLADDEVSFDATALLTTGAVRFEMKVTSMPADSTAPWLFKIESTGAATAVELPLSESLEGVDPVAGEWQTYTFPLQTLSDLGLDVSDINVVMVFPAWGQGDGAVYRIDNAEIAAQ